MDGSIRQLIVYSSTVDEASGMKLVTQAFKSLQQAFAKSKSGDDACGSDLYVQCAEVAYKLKQTKISQECLQMYFNGVPLTNQFLCRAYLCQAKLLLPKSAEDVVEFETAVVYLLKAINFAKDKVRYHFIVYNASVLYWQMARPFLREGYKAILHPSLQQVVAALEGIDDADHEWRIQLMIALIESYVDAGCMKDATVASQSAAQFALSKTPAKYKDVISLQIKHKLVDLSKLTKELALMPQYLAFLKLQKIKCAMHSQSKMDLPGELQKLAATVCVGGVTPDSKPGSRESRVHRGSVQEVILAEDSAVPTKGAAGKVPVDSQPPARQFPSHKQKELERLIRPRLLVDVARLCVNANLVSLAKTCLSALKEYDTIEANLMMECELIECEMMVKRLDDQQEAYTASAVEVRLAAIKRMDQALQNTMRSGGAGLVQGACAAQWNLCLPLLQRNLRHHVRRPLTRVAQALEDVSSLLVKLRCQVHTELAKCEESVEQIEAALKHLDKALQLDDSGFYHERLHTMLRRLQLSTQLYRVPDRAEDVAAIIIEQARKSATSGSGHMKRSLLIKAGLALAPDAFHYVLDSENDMKAKGGMKGIASPVQMLAARATQWQKSVRKAPGHLKRLGDENDRERARLWADLTKAARQQHVWDVCRVASMFCLLYDDGRWRMPQKDVSEQLPMSKRAGRSDSSNAKTPVEEEPSPESLLHDADLLRTLAEVRFISGEAYIHLLRGEGLKLNESPSLPPDAKVVQKGEEKEGDPPEWADYCEWIRLLNTEATNAFLRAIELGIELSETWIVCSGAVYLWNYNNHLVVDGQHHRLVATLERVLFGLQQIGHSSEAALLVRICDVIAKGLLTPWIPKKNVEESAGLTQAAPPTTKDEKRRKTGGKGGGTATAAAAAALTVDPDSADDLKKALAVCEYGLRVTNGSSSIDVIPTQVRRELLSTWVRVKQMLQQQISPNYGSEFEKVNRQRDMSKVLVILEMLSLNHNQMMEFVVPEFPEVCDMTEACSWDDPCVELEVWSRMAKLASMQKNHPLVMRCCKAALGLESAAVSKKDLNAKKPHLHRRKVALEMLAYAACVLGESFMETCSSNPSARRQAMHSFMNSAHHAEQAGNLALVMTACRRWWNAALPLIPTPLERELLRQPLEALLKCILHSSRDTRAASAAAVKNVDDAKDEDEKDDGGALMADPSNDHALRAAMYGLLFQTYADKSEWEEGLAVMDKALHHMPRTKHRLLLFKHRVIVKAKLGKNVHMDIAKFKDESEDYVSHMWHRVALCSHNTLEQLSAFQQAIEALYSEKTRWQKFEYLLELSTWMYSNEFAMQDTVKVVEWACDILLAMKFERAIAEEKQDRVKGRKSKVSKSISRGAPTSQSNHVEVSLKPNALVEDETPSQEVNHKEKASKDDVHATNERELLIGIKPADLNLKLDNLGSTRQLEGLIRAHVMLATISGRGGEDHLTYCQLAYAFVIRLWKISLASAGAVMKRMPKTDAVNDGDGKASGGKKRVKSTPKPTPVATDRPKRKGPLDAMPGSTSEWSTYEVPDEIQQAFLYDSSECGINKKTITCAGMTVYHLVKLSDYLRDCSLNHLSLPALCLASVITQTILKSSSWTQLINIRQIIVCYELHLEASAHHWEALNNNNFLTEAEQNASRLDLKMKTIHKELAKQEEARIWEANAQEGGPQVRSSAKTMKDADSGTDTLMGRKIGGVNRGEIWTEKARLLLSLGYRQGCRVLLNEALTVATHDDDLQLKADIYHGLASLATRESNTGQALQLVRKAQLIGGDEAFWKDNIGLLVDAISINQDPSNEDLHKVLAVIDVSLDCLSKLQDQRPTKRAAIEYMKATLSARACFVRLSLPNCDALQQLKVLHNVEENLQELGFFRDLASIHLELSDVLLKLSKADHETRTSHLLSAIRVLRRSTSNLTSICNSVLPLESDKEVSLPVHRELMEVQLRLASLLLHAAVISAESDRVAKMEEEAKGEIQRKVEEFVGKREEEVDEIIQIWDAERTTFLHQSFTILNTLHQSLPKLHVMRAVWLHLIGRCLRLLAGNFYPAPPINQWEVSKYVDDHVLRGDSVDISMKELECDPGSDSEGAASPVKVDPLTEEGAQVLKGCELAHRLLTQGTEVLGQSIGMALQLQAWSVVSEAALDMVECTAQCDATIAATHLALHQSACTSMRLRSLLMKSLSDPNASQLASLLHQEEWLMRGCVSTGLHASALRKDILRTLEDNYMAWRRMKLASSPNALLRDLPPSFNVVILQHCPNRDALYCAVLDKSKPPPSQADGKGKGKDKAPSLPSASRAFIARVRVKNELFKEIEDVTADFQQRLMSFLLQSEYQVFQLAMRKRMLQQLSKSPAEAVISDTALEEQAEEEMKLKEEFDEILASMESYLAGATLHISGKLVKPMVEQAESMFENGLSPSSPNHVIILGDLSLMHLPLEALCCFKTCHVNSVTRDMSLQMLHRRWIQDEGDVAVDKKKGERKASSKTPKGGSAKKPAAPPAGKAPQVNRDFSSGARSIDAHGVHFIVDPHNDCSATEEHRPDQTFKQLMQMYPHFTSRWTGSYGADALPSTGQWEAAARGCSAFVYYGMERFIAQYPPSKLSSFDLERCELVLILDKAQTHHSFRHQSKIDVDKTNNLLSIEKPLETAMLLSLRGANCVCLNQWHSTSESNASKLQTLLCGLMEEGRTMGEAIRKITFPHLAKMPPVVDRPQTASKGKSKRKPSPKSRDVSPNKGDGRASTNRNKGADHVMIAQGANDQARSTGSYQDEKPEVVLEERSPDVSLCNMVLFGLPNLTIA